MVDTVVNIVCKYGGRSLSAGPWPAWEGRMWRLPFVRRNRCALWGDVCFLMSAAASMDVEKHWEGTGEGLVGKDTGG